MYKKKNILFNDLLLVFFQNNILFFFLNNILFNDLNELLQHDNRVSVSLSFSTVAQAPTAGSTP
jgi:hypothetical protein